MSDQKDSGGFLNRWSERKQQTARPSPDKSAVPGEDVMVQCDVEAPVEDDQRLPADADMPPVETLTADSDISAFFSKGVSAVLRKAALRHVFRQPRYNVRDGLDDYDGDYTSFEPLGDTVTSDMKFHAARMERARLEAERLVEEQAQLECDTHGSAESTLSDTSSGTPEAACDPADELDATSQDGMPVDTDENEAPVALSAESDISQGVNPSFDRLPRHSPVEDDYLRKPAQTTASQPCETPDE